MKVNQISAWPLVVVVLASVLMTAEAQPPPPRNLRGRPPGPGQKKVKRHNLQRPVKPVYHSPPINAFSLKDLQKNVDEEFPFPSRAPLTGRLPKPSSSLSNSGEERYFASLNNQFSPNYGPEYFSPNPNLFKGSPPKPHKPSSFGLYGPGFGSITELYGNNKGHQKFEDDDDDDEEEFSGYPGAPLQIPYKHNFVYTTTAKPKLLQPSYSVKPANIKHLGSSGYGYPSNTYSHHENEDHGHADAHYSFGYQVSHAGGYGKEPQHFGHDEVRHGDTTKGRYHVLLPDGRHQKVAYTADHSGYHAQVSYTSHAHHPQRRY